MAREAKLKQSFQTKRVGDRIVVTFAGRSPLGAIVFLLLFPAFLLWGLLILASPGEMTMTVFVVGGGVLFLIFQLGKRTSVRRRSMTFTQEGLVLRGRLYRYEHVKSVYWESPGYLADAATAQIIEDISPGEIYFVYGTEKIPLKGRIKSDAGEQLVELLQRELRTRGAAV